MLGKVHERRFFLLLRLSCTNILYGIENGFYVPKIKREWHLKRRIHINQHTIRKNQKTGDRKPVISCKTYKENQYANNIKILGPSEVIYSPEKPLSCGARVWIETKSEVILDEKGSKG